jgi:hypothetical protein
MAWVKLPCVHNVTLSGGWHVELQTPIVLGDRFDVKCISSVWRPAGADCGVVIDEAFSYDRHNWSFVDVISTVELLICRFSGITA